MRRHKGQLIFGFLFAFSLIGCADGGTSALGPQSFLKFSPVERSQYLAYGRGRVPGDQSSKNQAIEHFELEIAMIERGPGWASTFNIVAHTGDGDEAYRLPMSNMYSATAIVANGGDNLIYFPSSDSSGVPMSYYLGPEAQLMMQMLNFSFDERRMSAMTKKQRGKAMGIVIEGVDQIGKARSPRSYGVAVFVCSSEPRNNTGIKVLTDGELIGRTTLDRIDLDDPAFNKEYVDKHGQCRNGATAYATEPIEIGTRLIPSMRDSGATILFQSTDLNMIFYVPPHALAPVI